jgi:hypothetical protein
MTVDTLAAEAPSTDSDTPDVLVPFVESTSPGSTPAPDAVAGDEVEIAPAAAASAEEKPKKAPVKKTAGKKTMTLDLTWDVRYTSRSPEDVDDRRHQPPGRRHHPPQRQCCRRPEHAHRVCD